MDAPAHPAAPSAVHSANSNQMSAWDSLRDPHRAWYRRPEVYWGGFIIAAHIVARVQLPWLIYYFAHAALLLIAVLMLARSFMEMRNMIVTGTLDELRITPAGPQLAIDRIVRRGQGYVLTLLAAWGLSFGLYWLWRAVMSPAGVIGAIFVLVLMRWYALFCYRIPVKIGWRLALAYYSNPARLARSAMYGVATVIVLPCIAIALICWLFVVFMRYAYTMSEDLWSLFGLLFGAAIGLAAGGSFWIGGKLIDRWTKWSNLLYRDEED